MKVQVISSDKKQAIVEILNYDQFITALEEYNRLFIVGKLIYYSKPFDVLMSSYTNTTITTQFPVLFLHKNTNLVFFSNENMIDDLPKLIKLYFILEDTKLLNEYTNIITDPGTVNSYRNSHAFPAYCPTSVIAAAITIKFLENRRKTTILDWFLDNVSIAKRTQIYLEKLTILERRLHNELYPS